MKRIVFVLIPLLLPACGKSEPEVPEATIQTGIDRSVADVRAAETAASGPVTFAPSAADLAARDEPAKAAPAGQ